MFKLYSIFRGSFSDKLKTEQFRKRPVENQGECLNGVKSDKLKKRTVRKNRTVEVTY